MQDIYKELDDLTDLDLPLELRKVLSTYMRSKVEGRVSSFVNLSLVYSNGRYTDFIRAYMFFELMRRKLLNEMEEICRYL